ncbi:MAG: PfkB family carbohydrate kinase, partial [Gemmatimonadota bacterium]|nr:PfkB family carbohydrate kinase [Gemmatimonadota bacterium]
EEVFDPTGAGDAFAGGFMGHLVQCGKHDDADLRRAVIYGSVLGAFACERFSVDRLRDLTAGEVEERVRHFRAMTTFELPLAAVV